jgi:hypothetical protein
MNERPMPPSENPVPTLLSWGDALSMLRELYSPRELIHVGAGRGVGDIHSWQGWGVGRAWVIDADGERLAWAQAADSERRWHLVKAVVAPHSGPVDFHHASNPAEDGLIPAEQLQPQWANLRTLSTRKADGQTLDDLLPVSTLSKRTWLLIDCLPAPEILAGAVQTLSSTCVVCARVIGLEGERAVANDLLRQGFVQIARIEGTHPAVFHIFFARDMMHDLEQIDLELGRQVEALTTAHEKQIALQQENQEQCNALRAEVDQLKGQCDDLLQEKAKLEQESGRRGHALAEAMEKQLALQQENQEQCNALRAEVDQLKGQCDDLLQEKIRLETGRNELAQELAASNQNQERTAQERDEARDQLAKHLPRVQELETERAQLELRISLLKDELFKAEGQIELIKDLILSEGRG